MNKVRNSDYPDKEVYEYVTKELEKRGITAQSVGEIAFQLQHGHYPKLTVDEYAKQFPEIIKKRDVLNILMVGFANDDLASKGLLPEPYQTIMEKDSGLFGVDEWLSIQLSLLYGPLSLTNYAYADIEKLGIAKDLDSEQGRVNTYSDDFASALAAAICGRVANKIND